MASYLMPFSRSRLHRATASVNTLAVFQGVEAARQLLVLSLSERLSSKSDTSPFPRDPEQCSREGPAAQGGSAAAGFAPGESVIALSRLGSMISRHAAGVALARVLPLP